jgi:hypothetical protein
MKKVRKLWVGIGAFVLAGGGAMPAPANALDHALEPPAKEAAKRVGSQPATLWQFAEARSGEAGEAGEGGEAGINFEAVATDPVEYSIALNVIAAHFHAGLLAYEGKEMEAGAQMFAHGLSEVYVEMEPVLQKNGVNDLGKKLQAAVDSATDKKPPREVRAKVRDILAALAAAQKTAPRSDASALSVQANVAVEMIERAAAQYSIVQKDKGLESYLDGLGFAIAARDMSKTLLPALKKRDPAKAKTVSSAVALVGKAYPGIRRPAKPAVKEGELLAAASRAKLAVSGIH